MTRKPQTIYAASLLCWLLFVSIHFVFCVSQDVLSDELYSNGIGFQIVVFCLTKLPYWLSGLFALLLVEFFAFRKRC